MDRISQEHRSWNMSRIKSQNTKPEILVRSTLHRMGYRFRLHGRISKRLFPKGILPGKPDIVMKKYRTVIFIHGCFWHRHEKCKRASIPKTRTEWWNEKLERNIQRDIKNEKDLQHLGWKVVIIWECEIRNKKLIDLQILFDERLKS